MEISTEPLFASNVELCCPQLEFIGHRVYFKLPEKVLSLLHETIERDEFQVPELSVIAQHLLAP